MRDFVNRYGDIEPRTALSGVEIVEVKIGAMRAEWIVPQSGDKKNRLVYIHGGGWVAGSLESHRPLAARLAASSTIPTLLIDYRLAPEHPFPAGLNDCLDALEFAYSNGPNSSGAGGQVVLAGDSAGANLAAAAVLELIARGSRVPDRLALMCAALDGSANILRGESETVKLGNSELEVVMAAYTQGRAAVDDPRISPLGAPQWMLQRFPPTLLQCSLADFLLWDSLMFASRLATCGNRTVLSTWPQMPHVWHAFLELLPEAPAALDEVANFLSSGKYGGVE